jgi:hypothetical protein
MQNARIAMLVAALWSVAACGGTKGATAPNNSLTNNLPSGSATVCVQDTDCNQLYGAYASNYPTPSCVNGGCTASWPNQAPFACIPLNNAADGNPVDCCSQIINPSTSQCGLCTPTGWISFASGADCCNQTGTTQGTPPDTNQYCNPISTCLPAGTTSATGDGSDCCGSAQASNATAPLICCALPGQPIPTDSTGTMNTNLCCGASLPTSNNACCVDSGNVANPPYAGSCCSGSITGNTCN